MNGPLSEEWQRVAASEIGHAARMAGAAFADASLEHMRPSAVFRPTVRQDGNQWCALYGLDLVEGVSGFGESPEMACRAFDKAWVSKIGASA